MDTTSFIPKKTLAKPVYKAKGPGLLFISSLILLVFSGLFAGGAYFYKASLVGRVEVLNESLKRVQSGFEPALILEMSNVSERIEASKVLLNKHVTLTPIFDFLEQSTLKNVRFSSFKYNFSEEDGVVVTMSGSAKSYSTLALQTDEFQQNKRVEDVSVSGLSLSPGGTVNFNIEIVFDPEFIKYKAK